LAPHSGEKGRTYRGDALEELSVTTFCVVSNCDYLLYGIRLWLRAVRHRTVTTCCAASDCDYVLTSGGLQVESV
jgi:hypothetical protein